MEYKSGINKLNLPDYFKFGIELEADNVKISGKDGLYNGESAKYIKDRKWHMAGKNEETLVAHGGAELVSPILKDTEEDWNKLNEICTHMKKFPGKNGDKVVTNEKCGLHVHFDAECIAKSPDIMRNFKRLYAESEELLYKMCNEKNNPIRQGALNKNFKGINIISAIWRNGMAAPSGKKILKQIENGTLKVSYKKFGKLRGFISKYKMDERRYMGLNLTNIGSEKKNTIEFRMANGSLEPDIIKQNVFLYASLLETAIKITDNPELYNEKIMKFYNTDCTEKEKATNFLNLIMDNEEDKKIYMDRWESVKDTQIFQKKEKNFAQNRFKREEFTAIAVRTPKSLIKNAYAKIKDFSITKEKGKDTMVYDR